MDGGNKERMVDERGEPSRDEGLSTLIRVVTTWILLMAVVVGAFAVVMSV